MTGCVSFDGMTPAFVCPKCKHAFFRQVGDMDKKTKCPKCFASFQRRSNIAPVGTKIYVQNTKAERKRKRKVRRKKVSGKPACFLPSEFKDADEGMLADRQAAQYRITGRRNGGAGKHRKSDPSFCSSMKWKQLRYLALKNTDGRCQCCGATAADGVQIHVDHIKPRSKYPDLALSLDNLAVLCSDCNIGKGSWDETDWREHWKSI